MADTANPGAGSGHSGDGETRRDFLYLTAAAMGVVSAAAVAWPIVDSMNPAADVRALSSTEVDLSPVEVGMAITVIWRGNPVFVRHRTAAEIETARSVDLDDLPDPETDEARVQKAQWLIMVGLCTHLGCIPKGQRVGDNKGDWDGWFCPCHASHYDTSGRIRKGPAPRNLDVPPYEFLDDTTIHIG
jgi:ubiquinol-cytochrome c reductase iron-sulfur subunit